MPTYLKFYDHSAGSFEHFICEFIGFMIGEDEYYYYLSAWQVVTPSDIDTRFENLEEVMVFKDAVIEKYDLAKIKPKSKPRAKKQRAPRNEGRLQ